MKAEKDLKLFAKYASLNVISMIGLSFYILADTYYIAKGLGENGLAALNLAIPAFSVVNGIGLMLGIGGATRYAIQKALKKKKECSQIFMNMIVTALVISLFFVCLGIFFSKEISIFLGADSHTLEMTDIYVKIMFLFAPAFIINDIVNAFVKNDGNPRLAMAAMLAGSIFNVIFDYIFIFPMNLGMMGAALATGAAPGMGLLVLSFHFIRKKNSFSFCRPKYQFSILRKSAPLGVPSLVTELSNGIIIIIFNILILGLAGNLGVAAYGIIANISLVMVSVFTGIAQGIQPVLSEAYGKGIESRVRNVLRYGIITTLVLSAVLYVILFFKADAVSMIFNRDANMELQKMAVTGIRIYFAAMPFVGINIILASYFASIEDKIPAQIISIARGFVLIIPFVFILAKLGGLTGIWASFPFAEIVTTVIGIICCCVSRYHRKYEREGM